MKQSMTELLMNPVRLRVVQYLLVHGEGTVGQMRQEMEIPPSSLYRHLKRLLEANLIEVAGEVQVRGTVERTYRLAKPPAAGQEDAAEMIQAGLLSLLGTFQTYFAGPDADPVRDLLSFGTSTLMLTDEEYLAFLKSLGALIQPQLQTPPGAGRKPRRLTIISSPCEGDQS